MSEGLEHDPRLPAAVELIGRTGAQQFQLRFCDEEKPVVWMALAQYHGHWEVGAYTNPLGAIFALCDQLIDGGLCVHCRRPSAFTPSHSAMPDALTDDVCWYQFDPELETFRRGCE